MSEADHEESSPDASLPLISRLSCSLAGQIGNVRLVRGSQAYEIYGSDDVQENFACNYGVNPLYQDRLRSEELRVSGFDEEGAVRIVELTSKPFFMATLFLPQTRSSAEKPHPLIVAYLRAGVRFAESTRKEYKLLP
jgi:CTP synthase (UTP-ammonia lyase)